MTGERKFRVQSGSRSVEGSRCAPPDRNEVVRFVLGIDASLLPGTDVVPSRWKGPHQYERLMIVC